MKIIWLKLLANGKMDKNFFINPLFKNNPPYKFVLLIFIQNFSSLRWTHFSNSLPPLKNGEGGFNYASVTLVTWLDSFVNNWPSLICITLFTENNLKSRFIIFQYHSKSSPWAYFLILFTLLCLQTEKEYTFQLHWQCEIVGITFTNIHV